MYRSGDAGVVDYAETFSPAHPDLQTVYGIGASKIMYLYIFRSENNFFKATDVRLWKFAFRRI